jgi:hypothetical protein
MLKKNSKVVKKTWQEVWFVRRQHLHELYGVPKQELDTIENLLEEAWQAGRKQGINE